PEYDQVPAPAALARELGIGLRATGLSAVVNLNCPPPSWADDLAAGPLFGERRLAFPGAKTVALSDEFLAQLLRAGTTGLARIDWHLQERDFHVDRGRLLSVARRSVESALLTFVFDRPRRPVALAEGLDRLHPAVLISIGLRLPALAQQPGARTAPEIYLHK